MIITVDEIFEEVTSPEQVYMIARSFLETQDEIDQDKEHFFVLHLDSRNKIKIAEVISIGSLNHAAVHPREVFTRVIACRTANIALAHNHPSGNVEPSQDDISITSRLQEAGKILGISVLDHVIFCNDGYYSMRENELI